jgi:hypothetical protein
MQILYDSAEDILTLRFSDTDAKIARDTSHGWHINLGFLQNGDLAEITILNAKEQGHWPLRIATKH